MFAAVTVWGIVNCAALVGAVLLARTRRIF